MGQQGSTSLLHYMRHLTLAAGEATPRASSPFETAPRSKIFQTTSSPNLRFLCSAKNTWRKQSKRGLKPTLKVARCVLAFGVSTVLTVLIIITFALFISGSVNFWLVRN
jgi:hypothetical protein